MNIINQGDYNVKRLDLIPRGTDVLNSVDYLIDIAFPEGQKMKRKDIVQDKKGILADDEIKYISDKGVTTKIIYQAYETSEEDSQFDHIESDMDFFEGYPHKVFVQILAPPTGGSTSKVSEIAD